MINIEERPTLKLPGITSLFVYFDFNKNIVDKLKLLDCANYNPNTKEWEIPLTELSKLLDSICLYDDITLRVLPDWFLEL